MLVLFLPFISALTVSIGNSRMVLRIAPGEEIERSILVKNINDVPVTIKLIVNGDLEGSIKLREESFILQAGEEKDAFFTVQPKEAGSTETKINVGFYPEDGNAVGLTSTIVVIADEKYAGQNTPAEEQSGEEMKEETSGNPKETNTKSRIKRFLTPTTFIISFFVLAFLLIILFFYSLLKKEKVKENKSEKSVTEEHA